MSSTSYGTYGCKCKKACASLLLVWLSICPMAHAHKSESHSLIVANSKAWKPFSYLSPDGEPKGILIDFWKEYAANNQIDVQFLLLDWDASLQAVKEGKADFHGGLVYSPERAKYMDFGAVIMPIQTKLYVNKDVLSVDIRSVLTGEMTLPIGVVKGSYESEFVQTNYPNAPIAEYINNDSMIQAAVDKKVLYFVADLQVANFYMATTPGAGMFVPTISLYSKDLRIAAGMHSATSILEVSRAFEKVIDTDRERILTRLESGENGLSTLSFPYCYFHYGGRNALSYFCPQTYGCSSDKAINDCQSAIARDDVDGFSHKAIQP